MKIIAIVGLLALCPLAHAAQPDDPVTCLTQNIYYEAMNEPLAGQIAVAQVVLNRMADPAYPNTICGVVYFKRHNHITGKLEAAFSWTLGRAWRAPGPIDPVKYAKCRDIAIGVINGVIRSVVIGPHVEYYHAVYIHPSAWSPRHVVAVIGQHIFYRE